jgi:P-type Mg2+ transporter
LSKNDEGLQTDFWCLNISQIFASLNSKPEGLTTIEAQRRLSQYGANNFVTSIHRSFVAKLARRLLEPLIAVLLIAAVVSGATGDWPSFLIIIVIVFFSIALDVIQERHAEATIEALRQSVAILATVFRDDHPIEIPVKEIVPGDIVELRAGELVPADGVILSVRGIQVNESVLTGEPYSVEKQPHSGKAKLIGDKTSTLFSGTGIVSGEAKLLVVATGAKTRFGAIAASIQTQEPPTSFEKGVHALGILIFRLTGFLVLLVLLAQTINKGLSLESFLFAVALAVGLTPELLPMIMTVTLARGALRMAKKKVVVKRLSAIHDLGAMDVLCTDKTGTLTEAKIVHVNSFGPSGAENARVTQLIRLNSTFVGGMHNNLDDAILSMSRDDTEKDWHHIDDLPFDFERRRASVLIARGNSLQIIVKGAPESVLSLCRQFESQSGKIVTLSKAKQIEITKRIEESSAQGFRLLGVARKDIAKNCSKITTDDETELIFVGCAAFLDPPKASATEAVARLTSSGVRVKIISGDSAVVVQHLVQTLQLPARGLMTGDQLSALNDTALMRQVSKTDMFARISPDQKSRIVHALRKSGHTVGFIGDGINDAPAIHAADVGLSVDGATEVARDAADIILLDSDLGLLADGVIEGRRTYANIMKYVRMGTSSNFGNMLSMALASVLLPFLPLAPLQILLNNLIYDFSEIGIPFDTADDEALVRPQSWDMRSVLRFTMVMGPLSSVFDLSTFYLLHWVFHASTEVFRTAWFVESITTQILVIFVIRTTRPFWKSRAHPVLTATSLGALSAAFVLALAPIGKIVGFNTIPLPIMASIAGLTLVYLILAEALKRYAVPRTSSKSTATLSAR